MDYASQFLAIVSLVKPVESFPGSVPSQHLAQPGGSTTSTGVPAQALSTLNNGFNKVS